MKKLLFKYKHKFNPFKNIHIFKPLDMELCIIKTNQNNQYIAKYYEDWGTFDILENNKEIGIYTKSYNKEIVTHWKYENI